MVNPKPRPRRKCEICGKGLREHNKSNLCTRHSNIKIAMANYNNKKDIKDEEFVGNAMFLQRNDINCRAILKIYYGEE